MAEQYGGYDLGFDTSQYANTGKAGQQPSSGGGGGNALGMINGMNQGLSSFGEAAQYYGAAAAMDMNASLLEMDATMVLSDAEITAKRMKERGESFIGSQVASFAKAGVTFEGSPINVMLDSEKNIRLDILTMKSNANRKANQLGWQAVNQKMKAGQARTRAVAKMGEGVLSMVSSAGGAA